MNSKVFLGFLTLSLISVFILSACGTTAPPANQTEASTAEASDPGQEQSVAADAETAALLEEAEVLRQTILDSQSLPENTGTTYYVSNNGNDKNDGKSPETAWATLAKVNEADLDQDCAVLFERGSIFRGYLACRENVVYSSYGNGAKPVLTGSPENGAGQDKWILYGETSDGGKIWKYDRDMPDCGTIILNGGEAWCLKATPCWSGTEFVTADGSPFDAVSGLTEDLSFFSAADSLLSSETPLFLFDEPYADTDGALYLRCDKGNPGELYNSIEFGIRSKSCAGLIDLAAGCLVDNLCICYTADCGFMSGSSDETTIVRNCEIAWCGGGVWSYDEKGVPTLAGDGFSLTGALTIKNCYIHHNFANGITIECGSDPGRVIAGITVSNNLISNNTGGIQIQCYDENMIENKITFQDFLIEGNYILHSGESWSASEQSPDAAPSDDLSVGHSILLGDLNTRLYAPNTVFRDNVIYSKSVCNLWGSFFGDAFPVFENNKIYSRGDVMTALWSPSEDQEFIWYAVGDPEHDPETLFNQELGSGNLIRAIH